MLTLRVSTTGTSLPSKVMLILFIFLLRHLSYWYRILLPLTFVLSHAGEIFTEMSESKGLFTHICYSNYKITQTQQEETEQRQRAGSNCMLMRI